MTDYLLTFPSLPPTRLCRERAELRVGRTSENEVVLQEPSLSRRHARFLWTPKGPLLEDLGSRHGCRVNGEPIQGSRILEPGDAILLGPVPVRLEALPETGSTAPMAPPGQEETLSLSISVDELLQWSQYGRESSFQWHRVLDLLQELSLDLLREDAPEVFLNRLLARLVPFLGAAWGRAFLGPTPETLVEVAQGCGAGDSVPQTPRPEDLSIDMAKREGRIHVLPTPEGPRSLMTVPLGEHLGLLVFEANPERPAFTEEDLRCGATFGNLAAAKLEQVHLAQELEQRRNLERDLAVAQAARLATTNFLANLSHEIRSPLSAILGLTELTLEEPLPGMLEQRFRRIERASRTMLGLLNDVLDLAKVESGHLELEARPFEVSEILTTLSDLFEDQARQKGVVLQIEAPPPGRFLGDVLRLGQVLTNLVGNALKFTEEGRVDVRAWVQDEAEGEVSLGFSVEDTGIGLSEAQCARLFQPFSQAEPSTTRRFGGTGLGLALSRHLVERMGGSMALASTPGEGSRFSFEVPLARA